MCVFCCLTIQTFSMCMFPMCSADWKIFQIIKSCILQVRYLIEQARENGDNLNLADVECVYPDVVFNGLGEVKSSPVHMIVEEAKPKVQNNKHNHNNKHRNYKSEGLVIFFKNEYDHLVKSWLNYCFRSILPAVLSSQVVSSDTWNYSCLHTLPAVQCNEPSNL